MKHKIIHPAGFCRRHPVWYQASLQACRGRHRPGHNISFCPAFAGSLLHIGQLQGPQGVVLHEKAKRAAIQISIKKIQ